MSIKFTLEVPTELEGITLRQYQKYLKLIKDNDGEESLDFMNLKLIEIFCKTSLKEANSIPLKDFDPIINHINSLFQEQTPLQMDITMKDLQGNSLKFGFIPKLDEMSMGEFVDLDSFITDWDNMHKAMAVLYRPITFERNGTYLIEDYDASDKYYEVMKDMPLNVALGAMVFFYRLGNELLKTTIHSLQKQMENKKSPVLNGLEKSGDGISQFTHSLKEMLKELEKLPSYHSNNVLYG
jgi:hypothetical protein